jgi:hypothetical protein
LKMRRKSVFCRGSFSGSISLQGAPLAMHSQTDLAAGQQPDGQKIPNRPAADRTGLAESCMRGHKTG